MLKNNQNIDSLIQGIITITKNRCSLLDEDVILLNEAILQLEKLKHKQGQNELTNLLLVAKIVETFVKVFSS